MSAWLPGASLALLGSRLARPVVLLLDHGDGELVAERCVLAVALARCRACRGRFRLLPADVLPHKHYGLALIGSLAVTHVAANQSLRTAAWTTHTGQTPAHTTLHAWTEGLGAVVLGRAFGSLPEAHPYQATIAAITARWSQLDVRTRPPVTIDPRRYRSAARGERLVAVAEALATARAVLDLATLDLELTVARERSGLCGLRLLAVRVGVPAPLVFRTGIRCTPSEPVCAADPDSPGLPQPTGDSVCQIRSRSPPSASSRSRPSSTPPSIPASDGT